jgi:hypothetical protein
MCSCKLPFGFAPDDPSDPDAQEFPDYELTESEVAYVKSKLALASSSADGRGFYTAFSEFKPISSKEKAYVLILMYHQIVKDKDGTGSTYQRTQSQFRADLGYLRDNGYKVIGFDDFQKIRYGRMPTIGPKMVILSFDDGWKSQYDNAFPILKEFGFKASFAIITSLVESANYMGWNQIREMARYRNEKGEQLFSFASHTVTHAKLDAGSDWKNLGPTTEAGEAALRNYLKFLKFELLKSATEIYLRVPENRNVDMPLVLTLPEGKGSGLVEIAAMAVQQGYDIIRNSDFRDYRESNAGGGTPTYYGGIDLFSQASYNRYKLPSFAVCDYTEIDKSVYKYFEYFY